MLVRRSIPATAEEGSSSPLLRNINWSRQSDPECRVARDRPLIWTFSVSQRVVTRLADQTPAPLLAVVRLRFNNLRFREVVCNSSFWGAKYQFGLQNPLYPFSYYHLQSSSRPDAL